MCAERNFRKRHARAVVWRRPSAIRHCTQKHKRRQKHHQEHGGQGDADARHARHSWRIAPNVEHTHCRRECVRRVTKATAYSAMRTAREPAASRASAAVLSSAAPASVRSTRSGRRTCAGEVRHVFSKCGKGARCAHATSWRCSKRPFPAMLGRRHGQQMQQCIRLNWIAPTPSANMHSMASRSLVKIYYFYSSRATRTL